MKIKSSYRKSYKIKKVTLKDNTQYFRVHFKSIGDLWFFQWYEYKFNAIEDAVVYLNARIAEYNATYKHPVVKTETVDF